MKEQRVKGRRLWIKLYPVDCLDGSIRYQLESDERGVWYDLLNFSAICAIPGTIADKDGRPYPHSFIANRLNISLDLLELTLRKCIEEGRIREEDGGKIEIVNWAAYQSEYQRQKPYREKKDVYEIPGWLNKETWDAFLEMRKAKKAIPTDRAKALLIKELEKLKTAGDDPNEVLNQSIMNSWKGVFSLKGGQNGAHRGDTQEDRSAKRAASIGAPLTGRRG